MADLGRSMSAGGSYRQEIRDSNGITLYRDNVAVLKAERGITLGLLKLVYSSDESNNGIVLGVKPRLQDGVPCLVTFDSTSLNYLQYDLIVQDLSPGPEPLPSANNPIQLQHINSDHHDIPPQNAADPELDFCEEQMAADLIGVPHRRSQALPDSNSHELIGVNVDLLSPQERRRSIQRRNEATATSSNPNDENPEPDSTGNPEGAHFNPEEFNFDINKVTPTQSDKGLRWPCDQCGKDYCSPSHLKRHWIIHTPFKPYKCNVCNKTFPFQWDLKRHMTRHTGQKRFKCPLCTKSFNTRKEVTCHSWLHTGKKQYKCQICHHEFSSPSNLKVHNRKHTGEKPYKCQYCPKAFHMQGHYMYHVRRHTGERPYKCDVCGKGFSYSHNLNEHKNIHTGHRPYSCPKCDRKFSHRSTMKQHILVHGGERPYKCHMCAKSFVQSSNYRMHLQTHKKKEDRAEKCDLCGKELYSRRGAKEHRKRCIKRTINRANSAPDVPKKREKKKGTYTCELCQRIFCYPRYYNKHVEDHAAGKIKQKSPRKKPSKTQDSQSQDASGTDPQGTRPITAFKCPLCKRKFTYIKRFKDHLQKKHAGVEVQEVPKGAVAPKALRGRPPSAASSTTAAGAVKTSGQSSTVVSAQGVVTPGTHPQVLSYQALNSLPRVHIQSGTRKVAMPTNVTIVYVPNAPARGKPQSTATSTAGSTGSAVRFVPIVPKPPSTSSLVASASSLASSVATATLATPSAANSALVAGSPSLSALAELSKKISLDENKREETGSQAITALKRLSAKVGLEHDLLIPERAGEARPPSSEHLSALVQLSRRVGDANPVTLEPVLDPQTQIPLRYPRLDQAASEQETSERDAGKLSLETSKKPGNESGRSHNGNRNAGACAEQTAKEKKVPSPKC